jgi:2,4-dienoyl-CoA reductase-like NADH-dependent reductase (Old Yellow Enzyme family)
MSPLFEPLTLRQVRVRNRAGMSPMCQYGAIDGVASDWHYVHSVSRAAGGAGLVMVQASAVSPEGRISAGDMGLWNTEQAAALRRITGRVKRPRLRYRG